MDYILASLDLAIEPEGQYPLTNQKASVFQGILMQEIDADYAEQLHQSQLHPYSQHIISDKEKTIWRIYTLDEEAYQQIILPLLNPKFDSFTIERDQVKIKIVDKKLSTSSRQRLIEEYYLGECDRYIRLKFVTPTAFKSQGRYNIRSALFPLEGVRIPAYEGFIVIKVKGPQALVNLANVLLRYAEYSGIGIKAAIGMGAIQIVERRG